MTRTKLSVDPEESDAALALLLGAGIDAVFVRRGEGEDVISVPREDAEAARRIVKR